MKLDIDALRDLVSDTRTKIGEEDLSPEEVADEIDKGINQLEKEEFGL